MLHAVVTMTGGHGDKHHILQRLPADAGLLLRDLEGLVQACCRTPCGIADPERFAMPMSWTCHEINVEKVRNSGLQFCTLLR